MNASPETIKCIEGNIGTKLLDTGLSGVFVSLAPKARETKAKYKGMGLHQTRKLLHSKRNMNKTNKKAIHQIGEDIRKRHFR